MKPTATIRSLMSRAIKLKCCRFLCAWPTSSNSWTTTFLIYWKLLAIDMGQQETVLCPETCPWKGHHFRQASWKATICPESMLIQLQKFAPHVKWTTKKWFGLQRSHLSFTCQDPWHIHFWHHSTEQKTYTTARKCCCQWWIQCRPGKPG